MTASNETIAVAEHFHLNPTIVGHQIGALAVWARYESDAGQPKPEELRLVDVDEAMEDYLELSAAAANHSMANKTPSAA